MAQRRKYKFNWLDHLYYMGVNYGSTRLPMPFDALVYSVLMWPMMFSIIFWASDDVQEIICMTLYFVVILFYDWPLRKFRFTHERERAYFRRYPQRKEHSVILHFWLPITIYLANIAILFFLAYLLR